MAKTLSAKSQLIRHSILAHPDKKNKELAEMINTSPARKEDRFEVNASDVAQQKQAMKHMGQVPKAAGKKRGRPKGSTKPAPVIGVPAPAAASPVDLIDKVFGLAEECGGLASLKRLVDRIASM